MSLSFHTLNRLILGVLLIIIGVILTSTLWEWEFLFRYYGIGGWKTSQVISRFVPAFLFAQAALILTDRAKLFGTIFTFSLPLIFAFLLVTHPSDDVMHYELEAFGSNMAFLVTLLVVAGLSVFQSMPKNSPSRLMDILAVVGIVAGFVAVGTIQPIYPEDYEDQSETLKATHFDALTPLDDDTKVFALFGTGCIHCDRAAQKLYLIHDEAEALEHLQFFFPPDENHAKDFIDRNKTKADYAIIDGRLFRQLNGKFIPGIYMRTDSNTFVAWRGGAFNMQALETIESAIDRLSISSSPTTLRLRTFRN